MSDGGTTAYPANSTESDLSTTPSQPPRPPSTETPALPDWPDGTVLPDEMIAQLRDTLGALDALLSEGPA